MGQSKSSDSSSSFASRLLVILFALGMVVIGVQPIKGQLRRYVDEARSFARTNFPMLIDDTRGDRRARFSNQSGSQAQGAAAGKSGALGEETRRPELPKGIAIDETSHKRDQLDKLSKEDRKQLSELVNEF